MTLIPAQGGHPVAHVLAVNVVHTVLPDPEGAVGVTAIDKRPVAGPVQVARLGLVGDQILDTKHHGGPDKAVYVYAREDLDHWERELGRALTPGLFGENLTTVGLDVTGAVIGERWQLGEGEDSVVLEVRMPRTPCLTFARRMGEERWVRRFSDHGAVGAYCSVVRPGLLVAGARVEVLERPAHGVTLGEVFHARRTDPARLHALVEDLGDRLAPALRRPLALALGHARKAGLLPPTAQSDVQPDVTLGRALDPA